MTEKELRKLSRADLLELLIAQMKENQELAEALRKAQRKLANKEIILKETGSIAEASLQLNGVFQAAQRACEQYLANVTRLQNEKEARQGMNRQVP